MPCSKTACEQVKNAHEGAVSAILCGIGITSSDVPILFELFKRFHILSNQGMRLAKSSTRPRKAKTWCALKFKWAPVLAF